VIAFLRKFGDRLNQVRVDVDGVGYYFARALEDEGFDVIDFYNGSVSEKLDKQGRPRFDNLKSECGWYMRDLYQAGLITGDIDDTTMSQIAGVRYGHVKKGPKAGAIILESKDSMAKRGVKSPDHFDAQNMALAPIKQTVVPPSGRMREVLRHTPAVRDI
jgi:hypothetical protein